MKRSLNDLVLKGMNTKLFFLCLFAFQFVLIFQGIEMSDEGFLATFYQQFFNNPESVQYNLMFWLTGFIGAVYFKLFSFLGLWGLRLGGVLVTTGTAVLVYKLLKKYLNQNYLKLGLFLVVITLNNDAKELNYNNLSALVYVTIIYFLFKGLKSNSFSKLFISGVFVSLNLFIRLPNILGLGLVLAIIYYNYTNKNNLKFIAKQVFTFLVGFLTCTITVLFIIYSMGHLSLYMNALQVIYKMGKANPQVAIHAGGYGAFKLFHQLISNNAKSILLSLSIFVGLVLGISVFQMIKRKIISSNRIRNLLILLLVLSVLILITTGFIDQYTSLFFYTGVIILAFLLVSITPNDFDIRFLLFCSCFVLVSYPFGSSAGIITAGRYSLWIGLPISLNYFLNIRSIQNRLVIHIGKFNSTLLVIVTEYQMRLAKKILLVILIFDGLFYSYFYPYFDYHNRIEMRYSIDNKMLPGIYTSKGRAKVLNELLQGSSKYVKKGDYVLAYDCIPLYNFLTESTPYIRSAYPWLYESEIFKSELDRAKREKKILPIIITQTIKTIGDACNWPEGTLQEDYSKWDVNQRRNKYMNEFLINNNYKEVWTNHYFKILIPN